MLKVLLSPQEEEEWRAGNTGGARPNPVEERYVSLARDKGKNCVNLLLERNGASIAFIRLKGEPEPRSLKSWKGVIPAPGTPEADASTG